LTELNLSSNRLSTLPVEIQNLKKLKNMDLRGNNFSPAEKQKIQQWLPNCEIEW